MAGPGAHVSDSEALSINFPLRPQATCPSSLKQPHKLHAKPRKDNVKLQMSRSRKEPKNGKSP